MSNLFRWATFAPIAAGFTFALFLLMRFLISTEFSPQEKVEVSAFEINPKVEKVIINEPTIELAEIERVETPPPPPQIERAQAEQPTEAVSTLIGEIPVFTMPPIDSGPVAIVVSDREEQPLVRIPPNFPPRFSQGNNSGYCTVRFDVSPDGLPFNVETLRCTSNQLRSATIKSVQEWKYSPKIVNGAAVSRTGVESKIRFDLQDERGRLLPLPAGF